MSIFSCGKKYLKERENHFIQELNNRIPSLIYIDGYNGSESKVLLQCKKCGEQFIRTASIIRIPHCNNFKCFGCIKLSKRDNNICYICGKEVDWNDYVVKDNSIVCGNNYPSIEHIIPLSKGGTHTWNNIKLAHRLCNSLKGNQIPRG